MSIDKLPDGFGSNFKPKVTDNDNNITGMKSHDCHTMMQRLLPIGAQAFLDLNISTPIIELCSFFKKMCARSITQSDMLKGEEQLIRILCNFEQIFPPAFFDIMIHLVMHLPAEAILGGPVYMRWMYPLERYMKILKNYVRNKAKPKGSIVEGYAAEEALTYCSHYLRNVETRFNRLDRNEDDPPPTCEMQISTLEAKKPSECSLELFTLARGPRNYATSYTSCIVNGVKFVVHSHDKRLTTQNNEVSTPMEDGSMYYGVLEEILGLHYVSRKNVVLF
ncbi:hypothetical protein Tco_0966237 [Tanacetum coccineum]